MAKKNAEILGVDIGGTGIKAAVVDVEEGVLLTDRERIETPHPATPEAVIETILQLRNKLSWRGAIGCGFPGVISQGIVKAAPNLDESWIDFAIAKAFKKTFGRTRVGFGNDADAAGVAEVAFGAARAVDGTVVMVTLGTGIGTAVFRDGLLLPYTELGHIEIDGKDAERLAANSARERKDWSWKKWGKNLDRYLSTLEYLLGVDCFVLGGGVSKKSEKFTEHLKNVSCEVRIAELGNLAGIIGAALFVE